MTMNLLDIPHYYLLAGLLGLTGQAIRGILGVIKILRSSGQLSIRWSYFGSTLALGSLSTPAPQLTEGL